MAEIGLALCDLVGVVREGVVDAAAVDIQPLAQLLYAYAGALDVPAGIAESPRALPLHLLILELGLGDPEHKVGLVALVSVGVHTLTHSDGKVLAAEIAEDVVVAEL